jgi:hypothetical protein
MEDQKMSFNYSFGAHSLLQLPEFGPEFLSHGDVSILLRFSFLNEEDQVHRWDLFATYVDLLLRNEADVFAPLVIINHISDLAESEI